MLKRQQQLFVTLLGCVDGVAIVIACYLAWAVRRVTVEGFFAHSWENWLIKEPMWLLALPIGLLVLSYSALYGPRRDRSLPNEWFQILKASVITIGLVMFVFWAIGNQELIGGSTPYGAPEVRGTRLHAGRVQFGSLAVLLPIVLSLERTLVRFVLRAARRRGYNLRHVAVIGVGRLGQIVSRTLERNSWTGLHVNYFISHHAAARRPRCLDKPILGGLDTLEEMLEAHPVDAVYLALPTAASAAVPGLLQRLQKFAVDVRIVPDVHPRFVPQSMIVNELDGMPILSYRESSQSGLGGLSKRILDFIGALIALAIFGPVMLVIAAIVYWTSPGPAIFRQQRVSLGARTFTIFKFRTMYLVDDELAAPLGDANGWTQRNDPRITPIGRWLRRTSLDELPQLFNVLKGEMSLVGPRPERPELIEKFREDWRGYILRQHVKAGMTGWAQVNGLRGQTSLRKRVQYDLFYVRHWSLWFDMRILWLTVFRGFVHRNAH